MRKDDRGMGFWWLIEGKKEATTKRAHVKCEVESVGVNSKTIEDLWLVYYGNEKKGEGRVGDEDVRLGIIEWWRL
jgi:hypothetical protein